MSASRRFDFYSSSLPPIESNRGAPGAEEATAIYEDEGWDMTVVDIKHAGAQADPAGFYLTEAVFSGDGRTIVTAAHDGTVVVFDRIANRVVRYFMGEKARRPGPYHPLWAPTFVFDGTNSNRVVVATDHRAVYRINTNTGDTLADISDEKMGSMSVVGMCHVSSDGNLLACVRNTGGKSFVHSWRMSDDKVYSVGIHAPKSSVEAVLCIPCQHRNRRSNDIVMVHKFGITKLNAASGAEREVSESNLIAMTHLRAASISPDGKFVALAYNGARPSVTTREQFVVINIASGMTHILSLISGDFDAVSIIKFSACGRFIMTMSSHVDRRDACSIICATTYRRLARITLFGGCDPLQFHFSGSMDEFTVVTAHGLSFSIHRPMHLALAGTFQPDSLLGGRFSHQWMYDRRLWRRVSEFVDMTDVVLSGGLRLQTPISGVHNRVCIDRVPDDRVRARHARFMREKLAREAMAPKHKYSTKTKARTKRDRDEDDEQPEPKRKHRT